MAVSLVKGGNVSLTKEAPSMNVALVGLGWDARVTDGQAFDLDASVFLVGENGKVLSDSHFVFYNNTTSPDGAVQHQDVYKRQVFYSPSFLVSGSFHVPGVTKQGFSATRTP